MVLVSQKAEGKNWFVCIADEVNEGKIYADYPPSQTFLACVSFKIVEAYSDSSKENIKRQSTSK